MFSAVILSIFISSMSYPQFCDHAAPINGKVQSFVAMTTFLSREASDSCHGKEARSEDFQLGDKHQKNQSLNEFSLGKKRVNDLSPAEPSPLLDGWLRGADQKAMLLADGWSSLHPEQDVNSPCYSGRKGDGPYHGSNPHGGDPHDEVHDSGLPANQAKDNYPNNDDPYGGTVPR